MISSPPKIVIKSNMCRNSALLIRSSDTRSKCKVGDFFNSHYNNNPIPQRGSG